MVLEKSMEYEKRVRSLRKHLTLDFHPLKTTLAKGLNVLVEPEAAVYCTATVEAFCNALFNVIVRNLHDDAVSSMTSLETKITVSHVQVALRSHDEFAQLLRNVPTVGDVLEYFMDDVTSKALFDRQLIPMQQAKHLRNDAIMSATSEREEELIRLHDRTRSEWQKREDDPFTEVDFAMVLKCVHPAFTLSYNATTMLSAFIRELLNEVCDIAPIEAVQRRLPPELYLDDLAPPLAQVFHVGEIGTQVHKTAIECLERFRLHSRKGATLSIRFRVFLLNAAAMTNAQTFRFTTQNVLNNVARETPIGQLLTQMCKKCHLPDASTMALIYRGHQLELMTTPAALSMPTGAIVYLVAKKWWDHTRRNEARRGLMSSLRPQEALVKSLVETAQSKVKKDFYGSSSSSSTNNSRFGYLAESMSPSSLQTLRRDERIDIKNVKPPHRPSNNNGSSSTSSLHSNANASPLRGGNGGEAGGAKAVMQTRKAMQKKHTKEGVSVAEEDPSHGSNDQEDDDDSLSLLLKQRGADGAQEKKNQNQHGSSNPAIRYPKTPLTRHNNDDNNGSDDCGSAVASTLSHVGDALSTIAPNGNRLDGCSDLSVVAVGRGRGGGEKTNQLAATSAQLVAVLDDAWLGFAGISGGVRSMNEKMTQWQQQEQEHAMMGDEGLSKERESPSSQVWVELEQELLSQLDRTEELVTQTLAAKELMRQLLVQVRQR